MKTMRTVGLIFICVAIGLAAISLWSIRQQMAVSETYVQTTGTVDRFLYQRNTDTRGRRKSDTHRALIQFNDADGRAHEFVENVSTYPPRFAAGDTVTILYDPKQPNLAFVDDISGRYLLAIITGGMAAAFAFIGGPMVILFIRRRQNRQRLLANNRRVMADFQRCYLDTSTKINGRSPFKVVAQGMQADTGLIVDYVSDPIWVDLTAVLNGKQVPVFIDNTDPKNYRVDLSAYAEETGF